jgi:PII-like signaling protein
MEIRIVKRLMIFIDETDRWHGANLSDAIVERVRKEGSAGATVLRGMVGFGVHGQVHTTSIVDLSVNLPVVMIVIDEPEKIDRLLPILQEMVKEGLITIDEVQAIRRNQSEKNVEANETSPASREHLVAEYMDEAPITVPPEMLVEDVIAVLLKNHRAYLPVVNEAGILLGIVTSQDLLARIVHIPQGPFRFFSLHGAERHEASKDVKSSTASAIMRTHFAAVEPESVMAKAVQLMLHDRLSALPVVKNNKLVGILRLPDVLQKALSVEYPSHS